MRERPQVVRIRTDPAFSLFALTDVVAETESYLNRTVEGEKRVIVFIPSLYRCVGW
jgi:hypothetical protein